MSQDEREPPPELTYREAGVDIDAQDDGLRRIRALVHSTRTPGVLSELGTFGGLYAPRLAGLAEPILVATCDGVGTKLRLAFATGAHDAVGRDLVHHCINDVLVQGAMPLFFLDYFATGRLEPAVLAQVVAGIAGACRTHGVALLGGETAEMPGFYAEREYDVAGFLVGIVDRPQLIDGSRVRVGDRLLGLASAGLHTNGFSLARKILLDVAGLGLDERVAELGDTLGHALLAEHLCYLPALRDPIGERRIHALAHITGGGLTDNVPRVLPPGTAARIDRNSWTVPPLFELLRRLGRVGEAEMFRTFNMGIGMVAIVAPDDEAGLVGRLAALGQPCWSIGEIVPGDRAVLYA
jgi:phosphoribosylformylglycinamidine cyclo-ligase